MTKSFRIAVTQYHPTKFSTWESFENHYRSLFENAKSHQSQIILLPEYAGLELAGFAEKSNVSTQFDEIQKLLLPYLKMCQKLAEEYEIYLQPGTIVTKTEDKKFYNRAYLFSPSGQYDFQDKIYLTPFEKTSQLIQSGNKITVFEIQFVKVAIAICYDSEFPALVQQLSLSGAQLILVPSCTDSLAGFHRVHLSCRSRALENQCYVANSCLVGGADWCDFIDTNIGTAGVFSPIDVGFPEDGVIVQGDIGQTQMIFADIDTNKIMSVRRHGMVRNYEDMRQGDTSKVVATKLA